MTRHCLVVLSLPGLGAVIAHSLRVLLRIAQVCSDKSTSSAIVLECPALRSKRPQADRTPPPSCRHLARGSPHAAPPPRTSPSWQMPTAPPRVIGRHSRALNRRRLFREIAAVGNLGDRRRKWIATPGVVERCETGREQRVLGRHWSAPTMSPPSSGRRRRPRARRGWCANCRPQSPARALVGKVQDHRREPHQGAVPGSTRVAAAAPRVA